eukprot:1148078-Pelagomonas_calceolata.AAC.2
MGGFSTAVLSFITKTVGFDSFVKDTFRLAESQAGSVHGHAVSAISPNMLSCCVCCLSNLSVFSIQHDLFLFPLPAWKQLKKQ